MAEKKGKCKTAKKRGKSAISDAVKNRRPAPDAIDASCPVQILGTCDGAYYFISRLGELRRCKTYELNEAGFQSLFDGDLQWLQECFPIKPGSGRAKTGCEFNVPAARSYLIRRCVQKGLFDGSRPVRKTGVWRNKTGRQPVIHCGDEVLVNGAWVKAGFDDEGYIYPAAPAIARPADEPATPDECREILNGFELWHFEHARGAEIALGLLGQAYIAGAQEWKAHGLFHGMIGSGKTTLMSFIEAALGSAAFVPSTGYSEAGLRQDMNNQARVGLLDEAENDAASFGNMKRIVKMIRQMSSGGGANIQRGTPGGTAQNFRLNSCMMMFCVMPPPMEPQDLARITRLRLLPLTSEQKSGGKARVDQAVTRAAELAPKLWRRAIDRLDHYGQAFHVFHCYLTGALHLSSRAADQFGTILAGADILLFDHPPEDSDSVEERIEIIRPLIEEWIANEDRENEGQLCLNRLYSSPVNPGRDDNKTIGKVILEATDSNKGEWARKALLQIGLRVENYNTGRPHILAANRHEGLRRAFRGSKWEDGWLDALRSLPGVTAAGNSVSYDGVSSCSTHIPFEYLPSPSKDET